MIQFGHFAYVLYKKNSILAARLAKKSHRVERVFVVRAQADCQLEPHGIATEPIRYADFRQPLKFGGQIQAANAVGIGDRGTDARSHALEATEPRAAATVASDL